LPLAPLGALAIALLFITLGNPEADPLQRLLATAVTALAFLPAVQYVRTNDRTLPFIPFLSALYGLTYGLALFANPHGAVTEAGTSPSDLTVALVLSAVGLAAFLGGTMATKLHPVQGIIPRFHLAVSAERSLVALGIISLMSLALYWLVGLGWIGVAPRWRALLDVTFLVRRVFMVLLAQWHFARRLSRPGTALFWILLLGDASRGLASGMLSETAIPVLMVISVYWMVRRRFPWRTLAVGLLVLVALQLVKPAWRATVWEQGEGGAHVAMRLSLWQTLLTDLWKADDGPFGERMGEALSRFDNLRILTRVVQMTPSEVPFQGGATYSYLSVAWIPRFLWPEKPFAQEANDWFGTTYGFMTVSQVGQTMTGMPHLVEAYVNFGWLGVALVMPLVGFAYGLLDSSLNYSPENEGGIALLAAIGMSPIAIETATAPSFGALLQNALVLALLLVPFRPSAPSRWSQGTK
jgi:hypothetical protein